MVGQLISGLRRAGYVGAALLLLLAISCKNQMIEDAKNVIAESNPVASPVFQPQTTGSPVPIDVTITCPTDGATVMYTTDGSAPSKTNGTEYSGAIHITQTTHFKAMGYKDLMGDSPVVEVTYTISADIVASPVFQPETHTSTLPMQVTITTTTDGATIVYTTNSTDPTRTNGTVYTGAIPISQTTTFRAFAYKDQMIDTSIVSVTYTISPDTVATPTFTPNGGADATAIDVTITCATADATIK